MRGNIQCYCLQRESISATEAEGDKQNCQQRNNLGHKTLWCVHIFPCCDLSVVTCCNCQGSLVDILVPQYHSKPMHYHCSLLIYQARCIKIDIKIGILRSVITRSVSRSKYQDRYRSRYHNSPCCTKSVSRSHLNSEMITIWHWNIVRYWLRALPRSERDGVISLSIILFYHNVYCLAKSNAPKNGICRCCIEWYWYRIIDRYSIDQHRIDRYSIDW